MWCKKQFFFWLTVFYLIGGVIQIVKSNRGKNQLLFQGYRYTKHQQYPSRTLWRCVCYYSSGCLALCNTVGFAFLNAKGAHNHHPAVPHATLRAMGALGGEPG
ncbi:uncharacterized protein LOC134534014 [Bacillus rossius redtenbacheri]|uniref:uncharacterized protein LOC134534014 n=1 Tax=Bacillus rossius redtenbacheri TaxID=93214 RepID=UPI002FDD2270